MAHSDDYKKGYSKGYAAGKRERSQSDYEQLNDRLKHALDRARDAESILYDIMALTWRRLPENVKDHLTIRHTRLVVDTITWLENKDREKERNNEPA